MTEALRDDPGAPRAEISVDNPKNRAKWAGCSRAAGAAFRPGEAKWEPQPPRSQPHHSDQATSTKG